MIQRLWQCGLGVLLLFCAWQSYAQQVVYPINQYCNVHVLSISSAKTASHNKKPETGWENVQLPDVWDDRWKNYNGGAWYKIEWEWFCERDHRLNQPIVFALNFLNSAGAVYLNQDLLWASQHLEEPLSKNWNMPRYWILPIAGLKQGKNQILVYVNGYAFQNGGIGKISFNNVHNNIEQHQQSIWNKRTLFEINAILSATLGILCLVIWLFLRRDQSFGWFALSCMFWLLFISHFLTTETFPYPSVLVASQANLSFFILYVLAFSLYLIRFVNQRLPILEESIFILSLAVIVCVFLTPLDYVKLVFGIVFLSYASLLVVVYFYLAYLAYKSPKTEVYLLLFCLTLIGFFAGVDVFRLSNAATASLYQPLSPYTSPVITLFIAIILGMRLKRNIQKIEKFNQDLELKVFEVSDDLKRSMSEKHYLELENVRLQERIHLSHDLHDGLGASLVRSMIMVDQSEQNMSNQQFLSMLKLLRDDLRQIIDSGSSIGSKVPENPKIWVAPVRHRFSQLMDEMDIHSKWDFPNEWVIEPNSLQCLTLMRVLEESLTNVIKHSQAKHVSVSMQFVPPKQLVLKIQDDGVGFEANSVLEHGMSIGMRSMKMRLERVGGQLKLNSTPGYTLIQAVLTLDPAYLNSPR